MSMTGNTELDKDVDPESLPDLSMHQHPPIEVEYDWVSVQEEDLNLGVKVMFTMTIVLALAMAWIILMTQDSSENICKLISHVSLFKHLIVGKW